MKPNTEGPRRLAEHSRGLLRRQTIPGHQRDRLAILLRQPRQRLRSRSRRTLLFLARRPLGDQQTVAQ